MRVGKNEFVDEGNIYAYIEQEKGVINPIGYELLGKAYSLAAETGKDVCAVLFGDIDSTIAQNLIYYGADYVYVFDNESYENVDDARILLALEELIKRNHPDIFLFGATIYGRALAAGLAARVETGLTADCTNLTINQEDGLLWQTRPAFEGNMYATIVCKNKRPQMATVRPGVMKCLCKDITRSGKVIRISCANTNGPKIKILEKISSSATTQCISRAKIIIAVGMGVASTENILELQKIAKKMGAAIGATRPVVDSGFLSSNYQIGLTGVTIQPELYIACGISGSTQHLSGIQNAKTVIAINTDKNAPIFQSATYGIIDDAMYIMPRLADKLLNFHKKEIMK